MFQTVGFWPLPAVRRGSLTASPQGVEAMSDRPRVRIVVVDDNYDANATLSKLLEKSGYQVVARAYDGLSGLNAIKSTNPDVAVLDIAMPALDGYGLARRVKSELDSPPRLIALTGFGKESDRAEATNAGFDAYFCKPADWSALESELRRSGQSSGEN